MGTIKDRNGMGLAEAEDIKKRWQEYTEELYKKYLNDPDNHDGMITNLGPNILECEVKWALGGITMNKATGGGGIPAELLQILKDDAVKNAILNMPANLENSAVATELEKVSFHSNPKDGQCQRMLKLLHNCTHLSSAQFSCSVMSNSLQNHGLQHARPPCPLPTSRVYANSCPLSWSCHPTISSSVIPFSFCRQSFSASGSFQMSQLFAMGGQRIGVSASASVLPVDYQD